MATPPEEHTPVLRSLRGLWKVDSSASESLNPLFQRLGVPWLVRSLVCAMNVEERVHAHSRDAFTFTDRTSLGEFTLQLVPDGRWRPVQTISKRMAPMRCSLAHDRSSSSPDVTLQTRLPTGVLMEERSLLTRATFRQVFTFIPTAGAPDELASPSSLPRDGAHVVARLWRRVESEEERCAGESAERAARELLAHEAATMSILSSDHGGSSRPSSRRLTPPPAAPAVVGAAAVGEGGVSTGHEHALPVTGGDITADDRARFAAALAGSWVVDRAHSDSMDDMLTLMGLPWVARKLAGSLEVTAVTKPAPDCSVIDTEDVSSMGVTRTHYALDNTTHAATGSDGRVSHVTCSLIKYTGEEGLRLAADETPVSYIVWRTVNALPGDMGETTDLRAVVADGRSMRQCMVYTRHGRTVIMHRLFTNKTWTPPVAREVAAAAAPAAVSQEAPAAPQAAAQSLAPDPFFVSLTGLWVMDAAHSDNFDVFWRSLGVGWLARWILGAVDVTTSIVHGKGSFRSVESSGLGAHVHDVHLDGRWAPVKQFGGRFMLERAWQSAGYGDRGQTWLGDNVGTLPRQWLDGGDAGSEPELDDEAEAASGGAVLKYPTLLPDMQEDSVLFARVSVPVASLSACCVETITVMHELDAAQVAAYDEGSGAPVTPPRGATRIGGSHEIQRAVAVGDAVVPPVAPHLCIRYELLRRDTLQVTYRHVAADGLELAVARKLLRRKESTEERSMAESAHAARLQHACTLLVSRRAAADARRAAYNQRHARSASGRSAISASISASPANSESNDMSDTSSSRSHRADTSTSSVFDVDEDALADGVQCAIV